MAQGRSANTGTRRSASVEKKWESREAGQHWRGRTLAGEKVTPTDLGLKKDVSSPCPGRPALKPSLLPAGSKLSNCNSPLMSLLTATCWVGSVSDILISRVASYGTNTSLLF